MDRLVERFSLLIASSQYSADPNDEKIQSSVTITFAHSKAFKAFLEDCVWAFSESPAPAALAPKFLPHIFPMAPPAAKFHIDGDIISYSTEHPPELLNSLVLSTDMALFNLCNYAPAFQTPIPNTGKLCDAGDTKLTSSIWSQDNLFCLPITSIIITLPEKQICLTPIKPGTRFKLACELSKLTIYNKENNDDENMFVLVNSFVELFRLFSANPLFFTLILNGEISAYLTQFGPELSPPLPQFDHITPLPQEHFFFHTEEELNIIHSSIAQSLCLLPNDISISLFGKCAIFIFARHPIEHLTHLESNLVGSESQSGRFEDYFVDPKIQCESLAEYCLLEPELNFIFDKYRRLNLDKFGDHDGSSHDIQLTLKATTPGLLKKSTSQTPFPTDLNSVLYHSKFQADTIPFEQDGNLRPETDLIVPFPSDFRVHQLTPEEVLSYKYLLGKKQQRKGLEEEIKTKSDQFTKLNIALNEVQQHQDFYFALVKRDLNDLDPIQEEIKLATSRQSHISAWSEEKLLFDIKPILETGNYIHLPEDENPLIISNLMKNISRAMAPLASNLMVHLCPVGIPPAALNLFIDKNPYYQNTFLTTSNGDNWLIYPKRHSEVMQKLMDGYLLKPELKDADGLINIGTLGQNAINDYHSYLMQFDLANQQLEQIRTKLGGVESAAIMDFYRQQEHSWRFLHPFINPRDEHEPGVLFCVQGCEKTTFYENFPIFITQCSNPHQPLLASVSICLDCLYLALDDLLKTVIKSSTQLSLVLNQQVLFSTNPMKVEFTQSDEYIHHPSIGSLIFSIFPLILKNNKNPFLIKLSTKLQLFLHSTNRQMNFNHIQKHPKIISTCPEHFHTTQKYIFKGSNACSAIDLSGDACTYRYCNCQAGFFHEGNCNSDIDRDTILTKLTPCCGRAYDFDACNAITCDCGEHFCALCHERCGTDDAHSHLKACKYNEENGFAYDSTPEYREKAFFPAVIFPKLINCYYTLTLMDQKEGYIKFKPELDQYGISEEQFLNECAKAASAPIANALLIVSPCCSIKYEPTENLCTKCQSCPQYFCSSCHSLLKKRSSSCSSCSPVENVEVLKSRIYARQIRQVFNKLDPNSRNSLWVNNRDVLKEVLKTTKDEFFSFYPKIKDLSLRINAILSLETPCCHTPYEPEGGLQYSCPKCQNRPFCVICHMLDGQHHSECNHESSNWRKSHAKMFKKLVILPQLWPIFAEFTTEADKKYLYVQAGIKSHPLEIKFSEIKNPPATGIQNE
jgi:hypothetical protein